MDISRQRSVTIRRCSEIGYTVWQRDSAGRTKSPLLAKDARNGAPGTRLKTKPQGNTEEDSGTQGPSTTQGERLRGSPCFAQDDKALRMEVKNMTIELESMAIAMPEVEGHPNREPFCGVLTVVDMPSQRAPSGSRGHQVVLTRAAAEAALPSLLGMAVDYAPSFDRHDMRRKVGVITRADVVGQNLEVGGYLFARDFPEVVQKIGEEGRRGRGKGSAVLQSRAVRAGTVHAACICGVAEISGGVRGRRASLGLDPSASLRAGSQECPSPHKLSLSTLAKRLLDLTIALRGGLPRRKEDDDEAQHGLRPGSLHAEDAGLGMSYEVTGVELTDARARVWTLTKVMFTGAAILRRDKAAYRDTWIELGS